jgi:hypothetical protein
MRCGQCHESMIPDPSFDSFDEHLTLHVTLWQCASCGEATEEILCESEGTVDRPRRMRYAVREWTGRRNRPGPRSRTRRTPASIAA